MPAKTTVRRRRAPRKTAASSSKSPDADTSRDEIARQAEPGGPEATPAADKPATPQATAPDAETTSAVIPSELSTPPAPEPETPAEPPTEPNDRPHRSSERPSSPRGQQSSRETVTSRETRGGQRQGPNRSQDSRRPSPDQSQPAPKPQPVPRENPRENRTSSQSSPAPATNQSRPSNLARHFDAEELATKGWEIYRNELSEEGAIHLDERDARDLAHRSFLLARIFLEERRRLLGTGAPVNTAEPTESR